MLHGGKGLSRADSEDSAQRRCTSGPAIYADWEWSGGGWAQRDMDFRAKKNIVRFTATTNKSSSESTGLSLSCSLVPFCLQRLRVRTGYDGHVIQLVDPFSVLAREQMPIGIHHHLDAAMSCLLLNVLGMSPLPDEERHQRMAQVMEPDRPNLSLL
jgi:hypothetical protein